jgi:hypothetical protein
MLSMRGLLAKRHAPEYLKSNFLYEVVYILSLLLLSPCSIARRRQPCTSSALTRICRIEPRFTSNYFLSLQSETTTVKRRSCIHWETAIDRAMTIVDTNHMQFLPSITLKENPEETYDVTATRLWRSLRRMAWQAVITKLWDTRLYTYAMYALLLDFRYYDGI